MNDPVSADAPASGFGASTLGGPPAAHAGALLREAREAQGLHPAALAVALKVPVRQIEALEDDRLDLLPDLVFARALAASVCRQLRIDPQPVLARLPQGKPRLNKDREPINEPFRTPGQSGGLSWRDQLARPPVLVALALLLGAIVLLALPLFQAGFHQRRFQTPYSDAHFHVWNDAIAGAGAIAFTGLSWAVLALISELFHLLKIDLLRDLMEEEWFGWTFSGLAFGAALGTLKNQVKVFGTLQALAMLVLSLLAVPLALGLVLFLLATLISGPDVLWQATRSATPLLLACAAGAFALCNAVAGGGDPAACGVCCRFHGPQARSVWPGAGTAVGAGGHCRRLCLWRRILGSAGAGAVARLGGIGPAGQPAPGGGCLRAGYRPGPADP